MRIERRTLFFTLGMVACVGLAAYEYHDCLAKREEHERVVQELENVERELYKIKSGSGRVAQEARAAFEEKRFNQVVELSRDLLKFFPGTKEAQEASGLRRKAEARLAEAEAERKKREEEETREREQQIVKDQQREKRRIAEATRSLRKEFVVRGIWFFSDPNSPQYLKSKSDLQLYFGMEGERLLALRLRIQYVSDQWPYTERYIIKADNASYIIPASGKDLRSNSVERERAEGYDQIITKDLLEMVKAVIRSRDAVIRYEGRQQHKERQISASEKQRLENVLMAFEAMGGSI